MTASLRDMLADMYHCLRTLTFVASAVLFVAFVNVPVFAIDSRDRFLALPSLPPSQWEKVSVQEIINAATGDVRFVARLTNVDQTELLEATGENWAALAPKVVLVSTVDVPAVCQCDALRDHEYIVSEQPVVDERGVYVSINDETHKALLEMVEYPLDNIERISVAFSELAYVYNAHALNDYLAARGFVLEAHGGMMNSDEYPGFRDTEYFIASNTTHRFLAIRGTSGSKDASTTLDTTLVPFDAIGLVHKGYYEVARHVFGKTMPLLLRRDRQPVVVGHSLGGGAAILVTMMLAQEGVLASNLNYAPVPPVTAQVRDHFDGILQTTNYFLPNEELADLDRGKWLLLPGERKVLPYVGTTAGAAHFVINYLKATLKDQGVDPVLYEAGMPNCVVEKYPCFGDSKLNFVSQCAFSRDDCFHRQRDLLLGYPAAGGDPDADEIAQLLRETVLKLSGERLRSHHRRALRYRLALLLGKTGAVDSAHHLLDDMDGAGGFHAFASAAIEDAEHP